MPLNLKVIIAEMDAILGEYEDLRRSAKYDDLSDLDDLGITRMVSTLSAAVDRFAYPGSRYLKLLETCLGDYTTDRRESSRSACRDSAITAGCLVCWANDYGYRASTR
jgi:hypothetical protein